MTDPRDGRRFAISPSRNLSRDLLVFHHDIPLCAHDRRMNLSTIATVRQASPVRVSWPALFLKACALVAKQVPELRQTWYRWPWAYLYQHPVSVGSLTVQRELDGEPWLFWGLVPEPDTLPLTEIQRRLDWFRDGDVRTVFRKQLRFAKLPTVIRRLIWRWNLGVATAKRAERLGTFFLSTLSGRGVEIQLPPSVQTGCFTFGPLDNNHVSRITLAYDHRVMDGALVAQVLEQLETALNVTLVSEMQSIADPARGMAA